MKRMLAAAGLLGLLGAAPGPSGISVQLPAGGAALDGRLIVLLSTLPGEPRTQVAANEMLKSPYMFGQTIDGAAPGSVVALDASAFGWPAATPAALPAGDYTVQAVLNRYETFHLGNGKTVKLPPDKGEGQHWESKPGNLYSAPVKVHIDPAHPTPLRIALDQVMPEIADKPDTKYIKHLRIQSPSLSKFWGRPVFLRAHVLLPEGFDAHPTAHYPLMVFHGHFPDDISGFRETPADANLKPDYSERFHLAGYNRIQQEEAYSFYRKWTGPNFPRFLVIEIDHANPYFDDSYAVNSANLGPYGDAINKELIPAVEAKYRGLAQGWARFTYGGSTGGWEALATQVFYPDMYNGAFAACPDPIDFRKYTVVDMYKDKNAYVLTGAASKVERPAFRDHFGEVYATQRDANYQELVLGDRARSGGQYDIWAAVFGPMGADGYPVPAIDKVTGDIDPKVAAYWREHYDLSHIIQRDWKTLGPKLAGKIHLYVGLGDNYFLNDSVFMAQGMLESLKNPAYGGEVAYGLHDEHCWNGNPNLPNAYTRLHYNFQYLPKIMARIAATAPKGADVTSWRY